MEAFQTSFIIVMVMYTLYYTCTERGKKERAQWGKPQKTKVK